MGCKVALFSQKVKKPRIYFRLLDFFANWSNWAPLQTGKDFWRPPRGCFAIVWEGHPVTQKGTILYRGLTGT